MLFERFKRLGCDMVDEDPADNSIRYKFSHNGPTRFQVVVNSDQDSVGCASESPDYNHAFCKCFEVLEVNLAFVPLHLEPRSPLNRNPTTEGCHVDDPIITTSFHGSDPPIMGEQTGPVVEVGNGLKDDLAIVVDDEAVGLMHSASFVVA